MDNLFITLQEFVDEKKISGKPNEKKVNQAIKEAQAVDLKKMLGLFYFFLVENYVNESGLMDGSSFVYNEMNISHLGIKNVLIDLAYSRYIIDVNVNLNAFGANTKETSNGSAVDRLTLKELSKQAQIDAGYKFKDVVLYIESVERLRAKYYGSEKNEVSFRGLRISKI